MKRTFALIILIISILSCSGKDEEKENSPGEENTVELNIDSVDDKTSQDSARVTSPQQNSTNRNSNSNNSSNNATTTRNRPVVNQFLSGRTELLSLPYKDGTEAQGFTISDLYYEESANDLEKAVAQKCLEFMKLLGGESFPTHLVAENYQVELKDYWDFFLKGKFDFSLVYLGKPQKKGLEVQMETYFVNEDKKAWVYMGKINDQWLMTGLEVDLREAQDSEEKWVPTVRPSFYGY